MIWLAIAASSASLALSFVALFYARRAARDFETLQLMMGSRP